MNKVFNDKLYYPLLLVLFGLTTLLNASPKLIVCACVYVTLALTANSIAELYGKKDTLISILLAMLSSLAFTAKDVNLLLLGSFCSVLVSTYCGVTLLTKLKTNVSSLHIRNFISLITASAIDSVIMASILLLKFPAAKCLSIALRDILYKSSYSLVVALGLLGVHYLIAHGKKLTHVTKR
jgi:uncharacterized PurR-regulated membrane protein YhhQ (DUF165 family)